MPSKKRPGAHRIAAVARRNWLKLPWPPQAPAPRARAYRHPLHAKILDTLLERNASWEAYRLVSDVLDTTDWDAFAKPETIPKGA